MSWLAQAAAPSGDGYRTVDSPLPLRDLRLRRSARPCRCGPSCLVSISYDLCGELEAPVREPAEPRSHRGRAVRRLGASWRVPRSGSPAVLRSIAGQDWHSCAPDGKENPGMALNAIPGISLCCVMRGRRRLPGFVWFWCGGGFAAGVRGAQRDCSGCHHDPLRRHQPARQQASPRIPSERRRFLNTDERDLVAVYSR